MSGQMLWIIFAVLLLGIFVGSNLGVMLMCVLQMGKRSDIRTEELLTVYVKNDDIDP